MKMKRENVDKKRIGHSESFLTSYLIREKLASVAMPDEDCGISEDVPLRPMNPFNPFPCEGQIRLLSQTDQITYVLLARKWGNDAFLAIPFSQYADPATDLELAVRKDGGAYLQVLQVWNARTLCVETLRKSWLIGKMDAGDLRDALQVWEYSVGGETPASDVMARTGVPIMREDDPRLRYQTGVLQDFARLDAEDFAIASKGKRAQAPVIRSVWAPVALAAGERNDSSVRRSVCRVKGFAGEVELVYSAARNRLSLEVFDASGATSTALDGWHLLYHDGTEFGKIAQGRVTANKVSECDGACCLLDSEGRICVLMPKKGR